MDGESEVRPVINPIRRDLLALFDHVAARTLERLDGLTDDEYRWAPAAGIATIEWRLCHVSDTVARHPMNGFLQPGFAPSRSEQPGSAAGGVDYFRLSCQEWRELVSAVDERVWLEPLGPAAGPYADSTVLSVALHNADEFVHHTSEAALLRDLYAERPHP